MVEGFGYMSRVMLSAATAGPDHPAHRNVGSMLGARMVNRSAAGRPPLRQRVRMLALGGATFASLLIACRHPQRPGELADVRIAKWKDGHRAAVSVNYDESDLLSPGQLRVQDAVLALGMHLDFELVTGGIS